MVNEEKRKELVTKFRQILELADDKFSPDEVKKLRDIFRQNSAKVGSEEHAVDCMLRAVSTALILEREVNLGKPVVMAKVIFEAIRSGFISENDIAAYADPVTEKLVSGLVKTENLSSHADTAFDTDNFRQLLLALAHDVRVIIILICDRLYMLQNVMAYPEEERTRIAKEASYLYAPLAHRLGLYHVKSQLEDLSMKFLNHDIYKEIAGKLNETKRSRDAYIAAFIDPLKLKLEKAGFKFSIKGRTKSIYSIWNKIKKQNTAFENIYDLFAIRIILDAPLEQEKAQCWQVYSIITDMYQPNPKRLRDWLSIPKSNGYESLHTTVMGPQGKWVEVQIRTQRMDEIAEKGFAAHFKYKGVKSEADFDSFLANVREALEHPETDANAAMDDFKLNLYDKEVFVFTPTGELRKLPKGATLLDFAFLVHSKVGSACVGGKVNGKNVTLRYVLGNGDQVEVLTSAQQRPKKEWLNIVQTSKAKTKIKQFLREQEAANMQIGKETLQRRFKNWKLELDDAIVTRLIKKMGYDTATDFYQAVADGAIDFAKLRDTYQEIDRKENHVDAVAPQSAADFEAVTEAAEKSQSDDVLVIDQNLKGIQYELARCCNPIFGDPVFGFVSARGMIKVHKVTCPNAPQMISRFGYRIVKARWSGRSGNQYIASFKVVGKDDIGIVTNISSLIQKEKDITLRSISVDSVDGLFLGNISVLVNDKSALDMLLKKVKAIKGVNSVSRY
jgi:guanosine-3',5'-bis(diphosphate) 3'-pyrophosphohydrolase